MNLAADLLTMLSDFSNVVRIGAVTYKGLLNPEEYALEGGIERMPLLLMRAADVVAAGVARESDVVVDEVTYQVRDIRYPDDGKVALLVLAT